MEYKKIEDFRKEYLKVKEHIYRQTNNEKFKKDYYLKFYNLCKNLLNFIYFKINKEDRTPAQRLYLSVYHDNITNISSMSSDWYQEYKDDILITNEQYLMLVHSILDNKEVKFAYNFYIGSNPLFPKEKPEKRKSQWFINKNTNEVQRYFTQEDKDFLVKNYNEKLEIKNESKHYIEKYTNRLEWAKNIEVYSDDLNIFNNKQI